jgi:hypothetical protein
MDYSTEISKAKKLLAEGSFNLCAMQSGRIIEDILRILINELSVNSKSYALKPQVTNFIHSNLENGKKLTLGRLVSLIIRSNAIEIFCKHGNTNETNLSSHDLNTIVKIRNKAAHEDWDDHKNEAEADAHIIYGYLLKLICFVNPLTCFKNQSQVKQTSTVQSTKKSSSESIEPQPESPVVSPNVHTVKTKKHNGKESKKPEKLLEVCKNKNTGKMFVFVREISHGKALFILPNGIEKSLDLNIFHGLKEIEEDLLISKQLISKEQIESLSVRSEKTRAARRRILVRPKQNEAKYISGYRNLLNNPASIPSRMLDIVKQRGRISWNDVKRLLIEKYGYSESGSLGASLKVLQIDNHIEIIGRGEQKILSKK